MTQKHLSTIVPAPLLGALALAGIALLGCDNAADEPAERPAADTSAPADTHVHEDGSTHDDHADENHADDEVFLGTAKVGDMDVEFAQGHGAVEPGKEGHLVVKLPYNDGGQSIVRAWLGTEDRHLYLVTKADYTASHNDYDAHAMASDPLPENVMWWVEVEKPDGTTVTGSIAPLLNEQTAPSATQP